MSKSFNLEKWKESSKPIDIPKREINKYKYAKLQTNSKDIWMKIIDISCELYQGELCKTPINNTINNTIYNKGDYFIFHENKIHSLRKKIITSPS
jgi:hypothetical protein